MFSLDLREVNVHVHVTRSLSAQLPSDAMGSWGSQSQLAHWIRHRLTGYHHSIMTHVTVLMWLTLQQAQGCCPWLQISTSIQVCQVDARASNTLPEWDTTAIAWQKIGWVNLSLIRAASTDAAQSANAGRVKPGICSAVTSHGGQAAASGGGWCLARFFRKINFNRLKT